MAPADAAARQDLRLPALGLAAWCGGLAALLLPRVWLVGVGVPVALAAVGALVLRRRRPGWASALRTALAGVLVSATVAGAVLVREARIAGGPVAGLADRAAAVTVDLVVTSDARVVHGRFSELVVFRARTEAVTTREASLRTRAPVLVLADASWRDLRLGSALRVSGRLQPADDPDLAARLLVRGDPPPSSAPAPWWSGAERVRASLRESVSGLPETRRALVPALVVGDDSELDPALADDFRTTGLTHLLAVSGTNLTLLVGFLLWCGRWTGVRGRWSHVLAVAGIAGFVLVARPEPSVLRAAAMGAVGLVALGPAGSRAGGRSLGVAVTVLLLVDPWLATSAGFALSVLATGGIVFAAPHLRDALGGWLPRWVAEAVAVPMAAQLACTPVVAALSGQVSLVAVPANLLVAPAVGPATVLGLAGALVELVWPWGGRVLGQLAGWCVAWIVVVARGGAAVPVPAVGWGTGTWSLAALTALSLAVLVWAPRLLRSRGTGVACSVALVVAVLVRLPTPGWPPTGWVLVACDVGQGDGLVLNAGHGDAVVVDAGPDPRLMDGCLRRLGVDRVPLVVLTHFHADHVTGLPGVLRGRSVGRVEVTVLADPPDGVALVEDALRPTGGEAVVAPYGETERVGDVTLQVLWPPADQRAVGPGDGSTANNASVVLLADVRGVGVLLSGDVEPEGQAAIAAAVPGLRVDVLKVPHHGSRYQDLGWLTSLGARVALVSVGADNDYGHPAPATVAALEATGARVLRTDESGDLAVVVRDGRLGTRTAG
ncbi:MAG: ComEC/Rec2 family competence protein [Nocardioidaceae bacterium]